jgi:hypothetical protein
MVGAEEKLVLGWREANQGGNGKDMRHEAIQLPVGSPVSGCAHARPDP